MNEKIIILAVSGILLSGCTTKSTVYQNVERTRIEFEKRCGGPAVL